MRKVLAFARDVAVVGFIAIGAGFTVAAVTDALAPSPAIAQQAVPDVVATPGDTINAPPGAEITVETAEPSSAIDFGAIVGGVGVFVAGVFLALLRSVALIGFDKLSEAVTAWAAANKLAVDQKRIAEARAAVAGAYDVIANAARRRILDEAGKVPPTLDVRHPVVAAAITAAWERVGTRMRELDLNEDAVAGAIIDRIVGGTSTAPVLTLPDLAGELVEGPSLREEVAAGILDAVRNPDIPLNMDRPFGGMPR
jgi:hypothetical protein